MKRYKLFYLLAILVMVGLAACDTPPETAAPTAPNGEETTAVTTQTEPAIIVAEPAAPQPVAAIESETAVIETEQETAAPTLNQRQVGSLAADGELSAAEAADLLFMREEEKLAHDVYVAFYETWRLPAFENIARSELSHMDSMLRLLEKYGLSDPVQDNSAGVFVNADLQTMYNDLAAQGERSLLAALQAAAAIEEIDILDLQDAAVQTDKADIQLTYQNLIAGSENHLRAFVRLIERQTGETYAPQYLTADAYAAIITADSGRNGVGQSAGGQGGGRQGLRLGGQTQP